LTSHEPGSSGFIGRQPELAVLTAALDQALSGRGQMVMLAGEPGIGKTRLAQEIASRAESLGAKVLWGWCYEHAGAPPYWPYVQPIRAYIEAADAQQLGSQMGPGGAEIAEIVPELRAKLPDLGQSLAAEPEQARFRLFDSVTAFLKNASQTRPMVFVVDDLHWADESSLLLLEFLAREIASSRLLVLGTYRDVEVTGSHPLAQTLGNLVRERHYRRVQLGGLTQQEVGEFVQGSKGVNLTSDILQTIHSRTDGNPLFVNEVVELIDPEQITENRAWADIIPEGVREAVRMRLGRLSETCNQVLRTASVIGREFDFSLLSGLDSDIGADGVLEAMEEALDAKVIEALSSGAERYQFGHALVQQALYEGMSPIRRVRAHARIGETLEQLHQTELDRHAAELAHHFARAEAVTGVEKLVKYSLLAGDNAVNVRAYDEALAHFQRGLTAKGIALMGPEPAQDEEAAALLSGLGHAQLGTHDQSNIRQVGASLTRAFDYYMKVGDSARAVTTALSDLPVVVGGLEFVERALTLVPPDSHDAGRLQARRILPLRADYDRAQDAFHHALSIARQQQDKALEMQALVAAACVDYHHCRHVQSLEWNQQAIDLAQLVDLPIEESHSRYDLHHVHYAMGNLEEATHHAEAMLASAERSRAHIWHGRAMDANVIVSSARGDWRTARDYIDQGLAASPGNSVILGAGALLEFQLGENDAGEAYLHRLLDSVPGGWRSPTATITQGPYTVPAVVIPVVAYITGDMAHFDLVEAVAQAIFSLPDAPPPAYLHGGQIGLALIAVQRRDETAAGELYGALQPIAGTMAPQSNIGPGLSVDRLLGLLSQTMGNLERAAGHFDDALTFCRKAGYKPELAWTCCDYAGMLLQRSAQSNRANAMTLLDESLAIATELGMRPLIKRVDARQERAVAQPVRAPAYPDGLTQREAEVIRLVAAGKTDREIAGELIISVNTVGNHVRSILNKTNAANRAEASAYAVRRGLGPDENSAGGQN